MKPFRLYLSTALLLGTASYLQADLLLLEDFESHNIFTGGTLVTDPLDAGNKVLRIQQGDKLVTHTLSAADDVEDNTTATLFFQAIIPSGSLGNNDVSIGFTDVDSTFNFSDYATQILFVDNDTDSLNQARDGNGSGEGGKADLHSGSRPE